MTSGAVRADRLLRFPMTFETSVVRARHRLERMKQSGIRIGRRQRYDRQHFVSHVAERTIVVIGLLVLWHRLQSVMRSNGHRLKSAPLGNHVLVLIMRKLDSELPLIFRLRRLICAIRFSESEPAIFARRGAHMTDGADCRASAAHGLTRKELRPVTTHACVVIRKIRDIGKGAVRSPCRRNLVTGVALKTLMFGGRV